MTIIRYYPRINPGSKTCRRMLDDDQVGLIDAYRMLADATWVHVLWALVDRELSVTELAETVAKPASK